jgi:hypothetical protein
LRGETGLGTSEGSRLGERERSPNVSASPLVAGRGMNSFVLIQPIRHPARAVSKFATLGPRLATWLQSLGTSDRALDRARPWRSGLRRRLRTARWRGRGFGDARPGIWGPRLRT